MVEVLEHGKRKVVCPNCKAKLQFTNDDVSEKIISSILGDDETYKYIICPDCESEIKIGLVKR